MVQRAKSTLGLLAQLLKVRWGKLGRGGRLMVFGGLILAALAAVQVGACMMGGCPLSASSPCAAGPCPYSGAEAEPSDEPCPYSSPAQEAPTEEPCHAR